jgi:hypothetical protein
MGDLLKKIRDRKKNVSVPERIDALKENDGGEELDVEDKVTLSKTANKTSNKTPNKISEEDVNSKIEKELASIPALAKPKLMTIQADIKDKMDIYCATNKITLDTLIEGMFSVLCEPGDTKLSEKVVARAKVGKGNRDRSRKLKTILTKINDID